MQSCRPIGLSGYRTITRTTPRPGRTLGELADDERQFYDSCEQKVSCAFCPQWSFSGTAAECREQAKQHREKLHPELSNLKQTNRRRVGCRIGDCSKPALRSAGRYAGLCESHLELAKTSIVSHDTGRSPMTGARIDAAVRLYGAGYNLREIAELSYQRWGYNSVLSCQNALQRELKRSAIPMRPRGCRTVKALSGDDVAAVLSEADRQ